jgi:hypothetical protein
MPVELKVQMGKKSPPIPFLDLKNQNLLVIQ